MDKKERKIRMRNSPNPPRSPEAQANWEKYNKKGSKVQKPKVSRNANWIYLKRGNEVATPFCLDDSTVFEAKNKGR